MRAATLHGATDMERIQLKKASSLKSLVFAGLRSSGYSLVIKTANRRNPVFLYYNPKSELAALYQCRRFDDELILLDCRKPDKIRILVTEMHTYREPELDEVADRLSEIIDRGKPAAIREIYIV